jgi:replicative DNA helicase
MFKSITQRLWPELEKRRNGRQGLLSFGISFLDDALLGIMPSDLILLGAPSGTGKTQICTNIALTNLEAGKRVHFIALEADEFEIERRLKFQIIARKYFSQSEIKLGCSLVYDRWLLGDFTEKLASFEIEAIGEMQEYKNLFVHYKTKDFGLTDLTESIISNAENSDLFIIDHAHYFDLDDDNENRAIKKLMKTIRSLALEENKPIILVAHLRKRDRGNPDLVPDMDEFHGSSDLAKIATRVITISPGKATQKGTFETFFRVPKNRINGGITRVIARMIYNPEKGSYEDLYRLGHASCNRADGFQDICEPVAPQWAKRLVASILVGGGDRLPAARPRTNALPHWEKDL